MLEIYLPRPNPCKTSTGYPLRPPELTYDYPILNFLILLAPNKHHHKDINSQPRAYIKQ